MTEVAQKRELWMRPVSFPALLRILRLMAEHPDGIRAGKLDAEVKDRVMLSTNKGSPPARTTLYHHRNVLVHIGALRRRKQILFVDFDNLYVKRLLNSPSPDHSRLGIDARDAFSEMVLGNRDCRELFFDLFTPSGEQGLQGMRQFRAAGSPVVWRRVPGRDGRTEVLLQAEDGSRSVSLRSPSEIKGVLYGLRYWARDELDLVDEFFREDRGSVVYPAFPPELGPTPREVVDEIFSLLNPGKEWTAFSVRELMVLLCEGRRRPLRSLFSALRVLETEFPRQVALVPTSRSFATLTATSVAREEFELRGYFRDTLGRYISHVRIHNSVRRQSCASAS